MHIEQLKPEKRKMVTLHLSSTTYNSHIETS